MPTAGAVSTCTCYGDRTAPVQVGPTRPSHILQNRIVATLGEQNVLIEQVCDSDKEGSLQGICLGKLSTVETLDEREPAGVLFGLSWTLTTGFAEIAGPDEAAHLLYISGQVAGAYDAAPDMKRPAIGLPDVESIDRQLGLFWLLLARLPAVLGRQEQLAAHLLLTEMGTLLIDLVVSLNGADVPKRGLASISIWDRPSSRLLREAWSYERLTGGGRGERVATGLGKQSPSLSFTVGTRPNSRRNTR